MWGLSSTNQYTITFDSAGGSAVAPITQDYGTAVTALADPTRDGYTFTGWNPVVPSTMPAADTTCVAQWTVNQYTITFNSNGGSAVAPITQDYGTAVTALADPTRDGYTFTGWNPVVPTTMPAANTTCVAEWTINQYTITFDSAGGSAVAPITQDYGTAVTAPADPTRDGYTFTGWNPVVPSTMPAANTTCVAEWTVNQYTITFKAGLMEAVIVAPITNNASVSRRGSGAMHLRHRRLYFYGMECGRTGRPCPRTIPAHTTCVRTVEINQYTITFDSAGGSAVAPDHPGLWHGCHGAADPTRDGYTFTGWNPVVPRPCLRPIRPGVAQWTADAQTLKYDANGGTGTMADSVHPTDTVFNLTTNAYARTGYSFSGWNTQADGTGTPYADGASYTMPAGGAILYAQWTINQYTITFDSAGGSAVAPITQDYGTAVDGAGRSDPRRLYFYGMESGRTDDHACGQYDLCSAVDGCTDLHRDLPGRR